MTINDFRKLKVVISLIELFNQQLHNVIERTKSRVFFYLKILVAYKPRLPCHIRLKSEVVVNALYIFFTIIC